MKRFLGALMAVVFLAANTSILTTAATIMPTVETESTISWPADQALPTFGTPAELIRAVDVSTQSYDTQVLARTFQGVINRTQPRIAVLQGSEHGSLTTWLNNMGLRYSQTSDLDGLVRQYADEIAGSIIYDESRMDTINVATTLAGLYDCIVVSPTMAQRYNDQFGLEIKMDLRTEIPADIDTNVEIYNWMYEHYRPGNTYGNPEYNTRMVVGLNPGSSGASGGHTGTRDLAVAMNAPVFWLDPGSASDTDSAERACLEQFVTSNVEFDKADSEGNPFYMGWWPSEERGIRWATERGWPTVPSDNFENYTLYSSLSQEVSPPETPAKPDLENKIYVALVISDGDNIAYNENAMRVGHLWGDSNRGDVPISWTISPALLDAAPQMLEYYYRTATPNDNLVCGPSGIGYTRASNWWQPSEATGFWWTLHYLTEHWPSDEFIANYAKMTNEYFEKTNMNLVTFWRTVTMDQINIFSDFENFPSLLGTTVMEQNASTGDTTLKYSDSDVAVMYMGGGANNNGLNVNEGTGNEVNYNDNFESTTSILSSSAESFDTSSSEPRFFVFQYQAWSGNISPTSLRDMANQLEEIYPGVFEFVRLDHLTMLVNEQNGKDINVALQADASASGSDNDYDASNAVDGTFAPGDGWQSSAEGDKWLTVDLGQRYELSRYVLKNAETGYFGAENNTKDYKIQLSVDGRTWTDADTVTGNTEDIVYRDLAGTARYVRVYITDPGADGVARIQDLEVYGTPVDTVKTELNQAIADVEEAMETLNESDYSEASWKALEDALAAAKTASSTDGLTQKEVDDATLTLIDALANLSGDKTALGEAIDRAESLVQSDYSTASWNAMQSALNAAKEVCNDASAVQGDIDQAATDLTNAIEALTTDKTALAEAIEAVGNPTESDYSAASWTAFEDALNNANSVMENANAKQSEIDGAQDALEEAFAGLTTDKSELEAAILAANDLAETDYSTASWDAMQAVLEDARAVYANGESKQSEIDSALNDLNEAVNALTTDKTDLQAAIDAAADLNETDYSTATWETLQTALDRANELNGSDTAKQSEIDAAAEDVLRAIDELGTDKSQLADAIAQAEEKQESDYSEETWQAMQDALAAAREVNDAEAPVQSEIDEARIALVEAVNALAPDMTELKSVIDAAEALNQSDYTAESWGALQAVLTEARAMYVGTDAVQPDVDQMAADLQDAIDDLVRAPENAGNQNGGSNNGGQNSGNGGTNGSNPVTSGVAIGSVAMLMLASGGIFLLSKKRKNVK